MIKFKNLNYIIEYIIICLLFDLCVLGPLYLVKTYKYIFVIISVFGLELIFLLIFFKIIFAKVIILDDRIIDVSKKITIFYKDVKSFEKCSFGKDLGIRICDNDNQIIDISFRRKLYKYFKSKISL